MTEKDLAEDYRMVLHEAESMGCNKIKALYNIPLKNMEMIVQALEKQIPKKPIRNDKCTCPSCGTHNEVFKRRRNTVAHDIVYCWHCGQAVEIDRLE